MVEALIKGSETAFSGKVKDCGVLFGAFSLSLLFSFEVLRVMEFTYISMTNAPPADLWHVIRQALRVDMVFFPAMLLCLSVPVAILYCCSRTPGFRYRMFIAGGVLMVFLHASLIVYFATTRVPLGADLFGYSLKEINETIRDGATFDAAAISILVFPIVIFLASFVFLHSRRLSPLKGAMALIAVWGVPACLGFALPAGTSSGTELSRNLAMNKAVYFIQESCAYFSRSFIGTAAAHVSTGDENRPDESSFKYLNPDYPFLRADETPDALGEFFNNVADGRPNLVFILVEGLGRSFSGPHTRLGSFTPFLDELAEKSLYWENFLGTQGRTFGALPSILASLPFAEKGFTNLGNRMPNHLSLLSILKHNGYRTKFYMSSDPDFDSEGLFLQKQGVDVLVGVDDFDEKIHTKSPGINWNYPDRELMQKTLTMESRDSAQPFVTFIQTISMHSSYSVPDQKQYLQRFEERMTELGFDVSQKKEHRPYAKHYSVIMYSDDALRYFFEAYAKLPAYENTIFILTGDHRLPEIPMLTRIERFHVPLIIFSPLLKRTAHIRSISSHLDITPSLLAYLRKNYSIDTPSAATWVGTGLDTETSFRNIHHYALKHTKANLVDYISGTFFISYDELYSVSENMELEPIRDEEKRTALIGAFNRYKEMNNRLIRELKLMPDSLYLGYAPKASPE